MVSTPENHQSNRPDSAVVAGSAATVVRRWIIAFLLAAVVFYRPLRDLIKFAIHSELYSHILLIPAISFYLVWSRRRTLPVGKPSLVGALVAYALAGIIVASYFASPAAAYWHSKVNFLSAMTLAMILFCIGNLFLFLGKEFVRAALFPTVFLLFTVPFPDPVLDGLEIFYQHSSAWVAGILFEITQTNVIHDGLFFQLPGITLQVAQECSGIHSSLVLMITSLVAGYFFFKSYRNRALLVFFVVPLGIVRNAFRIWVIGQLCVHVSPDMIHSYIHHHGGPIFFGLSLIPFFFLLHFLYKIDQRRPGASSEAVSVVGK